MTTMIFKFYLPSLMPCPHGTVIGPMTLAGVQRACSEAGPRRASARLQWPGHSSSWHSAFAEALTSAGPGRRRRQAPGRSGSNVIMTGSSCLSATRASPEARLLGKAQWHFALNISERVWHSPTPPLPAGGQIHIIEMLIGTTTEFGTHDSRSPSSSPTPFTES